MKLTDAGWAFVIIGGLFLFVTMCTVMLPTPEPSPEETAAVAAPERPELPTLKASVNISAVQLSLTSNDTIAWSGCRVTLNGDYYQDVPVIEPGQVITGGLLEFVNNAGERFTPATMAVREVWISCDTPRGGFGSARFR